ncbi:hypothetical protein M407DRAFT_29989 [Tulasnella calospora MUT 4182]|uniref:Uncharacterized protein n=1 Tax=Tulasnella calospora MUT 4182 TaxID=1051891 RepID=A0A0C3LFZ8_9AGAM|nr:hypothetical protein M407DRAFT_29989 [Tulasnella calospora MUT 4182]
MTSEAAASWNTMEGHRLHNLPHENKGSRVVGRVQQSAGARKDMRWAATASLAPFTDLRVAESRVS